jgi:hypothetical protein
MTNDPNTSEADRPPLNSIAALLVASGGGVVGHDCARAFETHPLIGAGIGAVFSYMLLRLLHYVYNDPDSHIKGWLTRIGAVIGGILGFVGATNDPSVEVSPFVVAGITALIGGGLGRFAATVLSLGALLVLLLSQGPVGAVVRALILNANE